MQFQADEEKSCLQEISQDTALNYKAKKQSHKEQIDMDEKLKERAENYIRRFTSLHNQVKTALIDITYNIKASNDLNITNPTVAAVPATGSANPVVITVPGVGESTILAVAIHNDEAEYGDYVLEDYEVEYVDNSGTTDAKITLPAGHATLVFLADAANGCVGEAQDLIIGLSDGRRVVSTLTVSAPAGSNP